MKTRLVAGFVTSLFVLSAYASAGSGSQVAPSATDGQALLEIAAAPIRSPEQLRSHLVRHPGDSPLMVMSPLNRELFLNSLRFNDKGLTTLRYDVLESLTPTEAYQVLGLFGMQGLTPQLNLRGNTKLDKKVMSITPSLMPMKDYYCEGKGTCRGGANVACSGAC